LRMILLGAPGAGKGTQADLLCQRHGWRHLATGDLLRAAVKAGTPLGKRAEAIMVRGDLVDDAVILGLIEEEMERAGGEGVVLDGFPRTLAQAKGLDALLEKRGEVLDRVVLLSVPEEEVVRRMSGRGRPDDTAETVRHRLRVYEESTEPLVRYYEPKGVLRRVDGLGTVEDIHARIESAVVGA
jgi:adenylate kinase